MTIGVYGEGDALEVMTGEFASVAEDGCTLSWKLPDCGSRPVAEVGIALRGGGDVLLDCLDWAGEPTLTLGRPEHGGSFWRRAWVDGVTTWMTNPPSHAFRLSQEQGHGLLIYGTRDWRDYRVSCRLAVNLGCGGIAARVQGMRRYYALQLAPGGMVQLLRAYDQERVLLAEAPCPSTGRDQGVGAAGQGRRAAWLRRWRACGAGGGCSPLLWRHCAMLLRGYSVRRCGDGPGPGVTGFDPRSWLAHPGANRRIRRRLASVVADCQQLRGVAVGHQAAHDPRPQQCLNRLHLLQTTCQQHHVAVV